MTEPAPLMPSYRRFGLSFASGRGAFLKDETGGEWLDFVSGVAVSSLGHSHPALLKAVRAQSEKLLHVSNLYEIPQAEKLARLLIENSFAESVFFCNSGAEANEALVKTMRRAHYAEGRPERTEIICFKGAFHGRTLGMLAATGNPAYLEGFGPESGGFRHAIFNDIRSVEKLVSEKTAGILLEPVQGEGGVRPADGGFMQALRELCNRENIYLGMDEVQCGMGRSGRLFAHEAYGVTPDILSTAKGLGGGFPIGATLARWQLARHMTAGSHGSTFGGNPLACAAALAVTQEILGAGFLERVRQTASLMERLGEKLLADFPDIFSAASGMGLMRGIACRIPARDMVQAAMKEKLLILTAGGNMIRLLPPLIIRPEECYTAFERLAAAARALRGDAGNAGRESS